MKKCLIFLLLLLPFVVKAQSVPGCGPYSAHAPITATSNTTISGDSINCNGAATIGINIPNGVHDVHVTKCKVLNGKTANGLIFIGSGCYNITIDTCFIQGGWRGINVVGATNNIHIWDNYFYDINDPNVTATSSDGGGSSVQLNNCNGTSIQVLDNKSYHDVSASGIGDQFSVYQCNGTSGSPIRVCRNQALNGSTNPASTGYVGCVGGDRGGSWQRCDSNTFVNVGSVLCQIQGGTNIEMSYNVGYLAKTSYTSVGMAFGNYSGLPSSNITMGNNRVYCINSSGAVANYWWDTSTAFQPTGWSTNIGDATLNASILPNPLFNTVCGGVLPAKPSIAYTPSTNVYIVGTTIGTLTPTNTGGAAVSYSVSPALPSGLALNTSTGVISGTPTAVTPIATYIVSATNTGGTGTFTLTITVNPTPILPPVISYSPSSNVYTLGSGAIAPLSPISTGGAVVSYSVSPALPSGLSLNTSTGIISGTPSATSTATTYTITGTNTGGSGVAHVTITVNSNPIIIPSISYSPDTVAIVYGVPMTPMTPTNTGSTATYSVSPSLPSGLTMSTITGVINGSPLAVQTQTSYVVTATNASGSGTHTVKIRVTKAHLTITAVSMTKFQGQPNPTLSVTYSGFVPGDNTSNSLSALPTVSTTAVTGSPVGAYPITASGAVSANYVLSYANGVLVVELPNVPIIFRVFGGIVNGL